MEYGKRHEVSQNNQLPLLPAQTGHRRKQPHHGKDWDASFVTAVGLALSYFGTAEMRSVYHLIAAAIVLLVSEVVCTASAFQYGFAGLQSSGRHADTVGRSHISSLAAKKKKKPAKGKSGGVKSGMGMGFGASSAGSKSDSPLASGSGAGGNSASKSSLESQWESYILITMMEMEPLKDTGDAKYRHFELADVFVQGEDTGWFRIGKICAADHIPITTSLTLHQDIILWTAERMYEHLKAAKDTLEVGYISPSKNYQAFETDGPVDSEDAAKIMKVMAEDELADANTKKIKQKIGFRPDFCPLGFKFSNEVINMDAMQNMGAPTDEELMLKMFGGGGGASGGKGLPPGADVLASNMPDGASSVKESGSTLPEDAIVVAGELEEAMDKNDFDKFFAIMRESDGDLEEEEARKTFDLLCGLKMAVNEEEEE